jgi:site-specific recombinase XerD
VPADTVDVQRIRAHGSLTQFDGRRSAGPDANDRANYHGTPACSLTPHVLRHSFAVELIRTGTDIVTVAELLGPASLDSARIYTRPTDEDLDAAIARLTVDR